MRITAPFEKGHLPAAVYAVDSVLVNARTLWNAVTMTGPSVVEGAAARVFEEVEGSVGETEVVAAALKAGGLEEDDVDDVAMIRKDGF